MVLFRFRGAPVLLHWSLGLMALWWLSRDSGSLIMRMFEIVALFGSVLLHEMGHMVAAERYGVQTYAITLYPFGGAAQIDTRALTPWRDAVVSAAGPATNLALAILFGVPGLMLHHTEIMLLGGINLLLAIFNMIPAYPMDGGRVLRALLSGWLGPIRGIRYSAWVGLLLSGALFGLSLHFGDRFLMLIVIFMMWTQVRELTHLKRVTGRWI